MGNLSRWGTLSHLISENLFHRGSWFWHIIHQIRRQRPRHNHGETHAGEIYVQLYKMEMKWLRFITNLTGCHLPLSLNVHCLDVSRKERNYPETGRGHEKDLQPWRAALKMSLILQTTGENVQPPRARRTPPTRPGCRSSLPPAPTVSARCPSAGCSGRWCRSLRTARRGRPRPNAASCWASTEQWSRWSGTWAQRLHEVLDTQTKQISMITMYCSNDQAFTIQSPAARNKMN